jgi:hypothetical protein
VRGNKSREENNLNIQAFINKKGFEKIQHLFDFLNIQNFVSQLSHNASKNRV